MVAEMEVDTGDDGDDEETGCLGCLKQGCGLGAGLLLLGVGYALLTNFPSVLYTLGALLAGAVGGVILNVYTDWSAERDRRLRVAGLTALGLGGAALFTALVLMLPLGGSGGTDYPSNATVSATGGMLGPIAVDEGSWVDVEVKQDIQGASGSYKRWSFVTIELLDAQKEYLSSFGGEFWNYAGYDDGYYWTEDDEFYETTLWMPAGTYHVRLKTESNVDPSELGKIRVSMEPTGWWGNPRPLQWMAYVACFLGAILFVASVVDVSSPDTTSDDDWDVDLGDAEKEWDVEPDDDF